MMSKLWPSNKTVPKENVIFMSILIVLTIIGGGLRIACCFWGYPYQLHPDEPVIVDNVIDMLSRHSWEAYVYHRPDQFEIKCNAIIFNIASWIFYHVPAYEAYEFHKGKFYLLARLYTSFFGIIMIPLMSVFVGKLLSHDKLSAKSKRCIQLLAAGFTTFSPIFIQHSAYVTPDIPLACLSLLIAYLSFYYLENGSSKILSIIAILTGISITIKYPAAIMCLYIAFIVIYRSVKEKDYKKILTDAIISICVILATLFIIAPNLYTDFHEVIAAFLDEASPTHLGADGLSFFGNLKYYFDEILRTMGVITGIFFCVGLIFLVTSRTIYHVGLAISGIYWVCLSILPLHWLRWGMPMFIAYVVLVAVGIVWLLEIIERRLAERRILHKALKCAIGIGIMLVSVNAVVSGIVVTKWSLMEDTRVAAMDFCEAEGITVDNSIYEGSTPLETGYGNGPEFEKFMLAEEGIRPIEQYATKQYYVLSSSFWSRYIADEERYSEQVEFYTSLDNNFPLVYTQSGAGYQSSIYEIQNIIYGIRYLNESQSLTGNKIDIYDLQPHYVTFRPYIRNNVCIAANEDKAGSVLNLSETDYLWTIYTSGDRTSFISNTTNMLMDVAQDNFSSGTLIELGPIPMSDEATGEGWTIQEENDYAYILTDNNMALSFEGDTIMLKEFTGSEEQKWIIHDM